MPHAYTEDQLCEQPAIGLFAELGWQTVSASEEIFGKDGTLGRETPSEVVLESRLQPALERLNPAFPPEAVTAAIDELTASAVGAGGTGSDQNRGSWGLIMFTEMPMFTET